MLRTIDDLFRADAALTVTCRNCGRRANVSAYLLRYRFDRHRPLASLRWRCTRCDGSTVRLNIGAASLAEDPSYHQPTML